MKKKTEKKLPKSAIEEAVNMAQQMKEKWEKKAEEDTTSVERVVDPELDVSDLSHGGVSKRGPDELGASSGRGSVRRISEQFDRSAHSNSSERKIAEQIDEDNWRETKDSKKKSSSSRSGGDRHRKSEKDRRRRRERGDHVGEEIRFESPQQEEKDSNEKEIPVLSSFKEENDVNQKGDQASQSSQVTENMQKNLTPRKDNHANQQSNKQKEKPDDEVYDDQEKLLEARKAEYTQRALLNKKKQKDVQIHYLRQQIRLQQEVQDQEDALFKDRIVALVEDNATLTNRLAGENFQLLADAKLWKQDKLDLTERVEKLEWKARLSERELLRMEELCSTQQENMTLLQARYQRSERELQGQMQSLSARKLERKVVTRRIVHTTKPTSPSPSDKPGDIEQGNISTTASRKLPPTGLSEVLLRQIQSVDLTKKLIPRTAIMVALMLLALKAVFVVGFTLWITQTECIPNNAIVNGGQSEAANKALYQSTRSQFLCRSEMTSRADPRSAPGNTSLNQTTTRDDSLLLLPSNNVWIDCVLPGFQCEDYHEGSPNCPLQETAAFLCNSATPQCTGMTSVTSLTCPLIASTVGSGMGFLGLLELVLVLFLVALWSCWGSEFFSCR